MQEQHFNQNEETVNERRATFKKTGLLLGAALMSGLSKSRVVQAADTAAMPNGNMNNMSVSSMMQPGMMRGVMLSDTMQSRLTKVTNMTPRDERGVPVHGVIATTTTAGAKETNDAGILNFALALEYLEADFYTRVVAADNARSYLRGRVKDLARVLQRDETTHVQAVSDAIRALGGTPIAKPEFVFPDDAFYSPIGFLMLSSQLEETGVSAYLGQGANVRRKDVLNFAASIYGNETRHAGLIKHYLGDSNPHNMEMPLSMVEIGMKVKPFFANPQMIPASMMQS